MVVGSPVIGQDRPDLFGIGSANAGWLLLHPDGYERESFRRIAQAGGVASRVAASWADIEATQGQYDWSLLDEQLGYCEEFGIELYALVVNTPAWASPTGQVAPDRRPLAQYEPNFQAFCTALASRYAGRITYYEFWNEENGYGWHRDDGFNNVEEYVPFLRMAYEALKAGDPNCVVSIGGLDDPELSGGDTMWRGAYYMSLFYDEVQTLGWENVALFDAVSDHPYGSTTQLQIKLDALHDVLVAHGDGDKPIWLTEWGYNTQGMSQAQQAASVEAYMAVLLDPQFDYVTMANYLAITDFDVQYEGYGLCDQNLRPKPAYYAFQGIARSDAPQLFNLACRPVDPLSIEVTWNTNIPATSQVEYGLTPAYGQLTTADATLTTDHQVLIRPTTPGADYHWRALSTAPSVPDGHSFDHDCRAVNVTLPNAGFEDGVPGIAWDWTAYGHSLATDGGLLDSDDVHSGSHSQVIVMNSSWGWRMDDGMYAQAVITPGRSYTVSAWTRGITGTSGGRLARQVGTDPTGGTDPDAGTVVWSAASSTENTWEQQSIGAAAQSNVVAVFIRGYALTQESLMYWLYIDDASFVPGPANGCGADFDCDFDVDVADFAIFGQCFNGAARPFATGCHYEADLDTDFDVDVSDFAMFSLCFGGPGNPPAPDCPF